MFCGRGGFYLLHSPLRSPEGAAEFGSMNADVSLSLQMIYPSVLYSTSFASTFSAEGAEAIPTPPPFSGGNLGCLYRVRLFGPMSGGERYLHDESTLWYGPRVLCKPHLSSTRLCLSLPE